MDLDKKTKYGSINVSLEAVASIAGNAATECYGVVGMANRKSSIIDDINLALNKDNYSKGVYVKKNAKGQVEVDVYIIVGYGLRVTETLSQVQKKVKYELEKNLKIKFSAVNVYVQALKNL